MTTATGEGDGVPGWFRTALDEPGQPGSVVVDGCEIAYLAWGPRGAATVVLIHGGAAHARWWEPLAPMLAGDQRVVAIDLSGHGASGWRERYSAIRWADEVLAVAEAAGGSGPPVVVGHSMGGLVAIVAAANHGHRLEGVIVVDSPVRRPDPESEEGRAGRMFRSPKTYPDVETAIEHFHLVPSQPVVHDWLHEHVARASLRQVDDGYTWRFDPELFSKRFGPFRPSDFAEQLAAAACRVAVMNGARSEVVDDDTRAYMAELLAGSPAASAGVPFLEIPEAHHHVMFDQPLALVTGLRAVLAAWRPIGAPPKDVVLGS